MLIINVNVNQFSLCHFLNCYIVNRWSSEHFSGQKHPDVGSKMSCYVSGGGGVGEGKKKVTQLKPLKDDT